jgi:tRNA(Arg) A34 adenosine deaminase TadA
VNSQTIFLVDRMLAVLREDVLPLTREGVREGNKTFGSAVLRKRSLDFVAAGTNEEAQNPLLHGATGRSHLRAALRPQSVCSCRATSPMCLSAIAWSGFDNFYYLFSYEDTRDEFEIPHDRAILAEVFRCPDERMPMRTLTGRATTCSTSSSRDRRTSERGRASKSQTCGQPTASSPPTTRRGNGRATFRLHEGTRTL